MENPKYTLTAEYDGQNTLEIAYHDFAADPDEPIFQTVLTLSQPLVGGDNKRIGELAEAIAIFVETARKYLLCDEPLPQPENTQA